MKESQSPVADTAASLRVALPHPRLIKRSGLFRSPNQLVIGPLLLLLVAWMVSGVQAQQPSPLASSSSHGNERVLVSENSELNREGHDSSLAKQIVLWPIRLVRHIAGKFFHSQNNQLFEKSPDRFARPASAAATNNICYRWRTQVDPLEKRIVMDETRLSDREIEEGIGCLLELKGQRHKAQFYGYTRANYNKSEGYRPPKNPASVEIAALYYASYLFNNNWERAGSVVLFDEATGKTNTKRIAERAFQSYREWYKRVLGMGLKQAREKKLDPLEQSGIFWEPGQANDEDVFAPVPASLRPRLVERLKQLIEYQRTQQWEKQYDMLSQLITQGDSKEQYVTQHQRWQAEGVESLILAFTPKSVTYQEGGPSDVVSFGCATLIEDGKVVERYASVAAYREKNDWYFSPVGMVTQIGSKPEPCPYSLAGGTMKR